MRRSLAFVFVLFLAAAVATPSVAKLYPATQAKIESELMSKNYVAKVDLYEAKVYPDGTVDSEYDKEAIKKGQKIIFKDIEFGKKKIEITLQHPYLKDKTEVVFLFDIPISGDFSQERDQWKKMVDAVFEEEGAGEGE
jgi:hypothetical protein